MPNVSPMSPDTLVSKLIPWYLEMRRPLPWRANRDPYRIWVSEVMLQQTTVTAVIPYYERFMRRFPTLETLATAKEEAVLENWAGLGYYSRARSLHKSAKALRELGHFPKKFSELIELPGFGPYTSRAVSSLAFGEPVGVVDGNVIRVLSRVMDLDLEWWKPKDRDVIQIEADRLANGRADKRKVDPSDLNQALMELGATVCTPQNPTCMLCPWSRECRARNNDTISLRPRPKPRRETEIWMWTPEIIRRRDNSLLLVKNDYAPFLKGHMIWPGQVVRLKKKPKSFHYKGGVTHHEIYVNVECSKKTVSARELKRWAHGEMQWVLPDEMKTKVPSSLIRKALSVLGLDDSAKD
jgi:A/G-specific adenine glycosylase